MDGECAEQWWAWAERPAQVQVHLENVVKCCLEAGGECSFLFSVGLINSKS